jgi:hypothetical protein
MASFITGGAFSLDGVHLTPRGYAIAANAIIEEINGKFNARIYTGHHQQSSCGSAAIKLFSTNLKAWILSGLFHLGICVSYYLQAKEELVKLP